MTKKRDQPNRRRQKVTVDIYRAGQTGIRQPIPNLVIRTVAEPPTFGTVEMQRAAFAAQADAIVDALLTHLPGGLVDQLIAALLLRTASDLRVPRK
jgi:hypothetical protein